MKIIASTFTADGIVKKELDFPKGELAGIYIYGDAGTSIYMYEQTSDGGGLSTASLSDILTIVPIDNKEIWIYARELFKNNPEHI